MLTEIVPIKCIIYFGLFCLELEASVETATEAREPPPPDIADLCRETFRKTAEYMQGELACKYTESVK